MGLLRTERLPRQARDNRRTQLNNKGGCFLFSQKHYVANSVDNTRINKSVTVDGQHYSAGDLVTRHTTDVTISNAQLQEYLAVRRTPLFEPFMYKIDLWTKTGSGQT
jgi:hypothetical protein